MGGNEPGSPQSPFPVPPTLLPRSQRVWFRRINLSLPVTGIFLASSLAFMGEGRGVAAGTSLRGPRLPSAAATCPCQSQDFRPPPRQGPPITAQPSQLRHQQPISACSAADGGEDAGEQGASACSALAAPGTPRVSQIPSPSPPSQRTMTGRQVPPLQAAPYCSSPQSSRSCYP